MRSLPGVVDASFSQPGKYLVICNLTPHFSFFKMYRWVIVK